MSDDYDQDYSDDFVSDDEDKGRRSKNKGRRESTDFWSSGWSQTKATRRKQSTYHDSPIESDRDSKADSLEDYDRLPLNRSNSSRLRSAQPRRLTLSRGLTHTRTPASHFIAELTEETLSPIREPVKPQTRAQKAVGRNQKQTSWAGGRRTGPAQSSHGRNRGGMKPKGRGKTRGYATAKQSPRLDNVTQRMLSASRVKMNELRNQLEDQNHVIRELKEENKLLKKMQYRQEKSLAKFEDQESDLPRLILKHNNELRAQKEQLRVMKEKYEKTNRYLRDAEDDLDRAESKVKKYKSLVENKNLPERDELNKKLTRAEQDIEEKDIKIRDLQRHADHLSKNHRHELGVEIARHRETRRQMEQIKEEKENLENKLKEKEKELDIKNIYSNRVMRPPHKLPNSYGGTPLDSPPATHRKRIPSHTELTAREKARMFELKRREEMKKNKPKPRPRQEKPTEMFVNRDSLEEDRNRLFLEEKERRERENRFLQAQEEEEREREQERERERERERDRERDRQRAREREKQREREREEEEDLRKERDRMKRESHELESRKREQREREDRERRERDERDRIEREERERREQYEREKELERKAREERERLENDPKVLEERRKKDLLLARLKAIDNTTEQDSPNRSPFDDSSSPSSKKSYSFSKPTENLHNGKPAYEEVSVPYLERRKSQKGRDDDIGGYNPSFGGSSSKFKSGSGETPSPSKKNNRKAALMSDLFGDNSGRAEKDDDFLFSSDTKKKSTGRQSGFTWEDNSGKQTGSASRNRENSSTLFGGGAALVDDDSSNDKSKLLPRRSRHHTSTFSSKPAVTAVDTFEDDIEEVML